MTAASQDPGEWKATAGKAPLPVALQPNRPRHFYRGGSNIAQLRGLPDDCDHAPEDWVASTTERFTDPGVGLSRLPDGTLLREAVAAQPQLWLGSDHVAHFGTSTGLLVKLLDAGQRLPVHCHPDDSFARRHLGSRFGKTEAWVVVGTTGTNPVAYLGFREDVAPATVANWVRTQDCSAMLGALNEVPVRAGDTVHVPAGTPHAVGAGVFMVELQQPTDLSITLEWEGILSDSENALLGMDAQSALHALNHRGLDRSRLSALIKRTSQDDRATVPLLSEQAAPFFRAERLRPGNGMELEPSFGVLVVLSGQGMLRCDAGSSLTLRRGDTIVTPHSAGALTLEGNVVAVHCRPPSPEMATALGDGDE